MNTVAVILARAASTRLPNKMFLPFGEHSILDHVIERVRACRHIDDCVLATSEHPRDEAFASVVSRQQIRWFQGSEIDVIGRMVQALENCSSTPTHVVRICSDNPMLMPEVVDDAICTLAQSSADLITPFEFHSYPFGFGAVVMTRECLLRLNNQAQSATYREHVENYCFDHPNDFSILYQQAPATQDLHGLGLTLDYAEDYDRLLRVRTQMAAVKLGKQAVALSEWVVQQKDAQGPLEPKTVQIAGQAHWGLQIPGMNDRPSQMVFIDGQPCHPDEDGFAFLHRVEHRVRAQLRLAPHRKASGPSFHCALPNKHGNTGERLGFNNSAAAFFPPTIVLHLNHRPAPYLESLIKQIQFEPVKELICLGPDETCRQVAIAIREHWPTAPLHFIRKKLHRSSLQRSFTTVEVSSDGQLSIPGINVVNSIRCTTIANFWHDATVRRARVDALNDWGQR